MNRFFIWSSRSKGLAFNERFYQIALIKVGTGFGEQIKLYALSKSTGIAMRTMAETISVASLIVRECEERGENCDAVLDDLEADKHIDEAARVSINHKLELYRKMLYERLKIALENERYLSAIFPVLSHIHTGISSFVAFEKEYSVLDDSPDTYEPGNYRIEPVLLVQIDVNRYGKKDMFGFALRAEQLTEIIKRLRLAEKQLKSVVAKPT